MNIFLLSCAGFLMSAFSPSFFPHAPAAAGQRYSLKYYDVGTDDIIFTDDLVYESLAWSELDCARQCSIRNGCLASTYIKGSEVTSPGLCRGHPSVVLTSSGAEVTATNGTKTYRQAGASGE